MVTHGNEYRPGQQTCRVVTGHGPSRPSWYQSANDEFARNMAAYKRWLQANGPNREPEIQVSGTTNDVQEQTAVEVLKGIEKRQSIFGGFAAEWT